MYRNIVLFSMITLVCFGSVFAADTRLESGINLGVVEPGMTAKDYYTPEQLALIAVKEYTYMSYQAPELIDTFFDEADRALIDEFLSMCDEGTVDPDYGTTQYASNYTKLAMTRKVQETSYWCGPASTQMLQYYFDQPCSQTYIAQQEGTTSTNGTYVYRIVNFLNDSPRTGYKYLPSWWVWEALYVSGSQTTFESKLQWSMYNYKAPQIFHVRTNPSGTWGLPGYTSNYGHYVAGYGFDYRTSSKIVHYHDPYYAQGGGTRSTSTANMWNCIKANAGYIIY